jgi:Phosphotransferase enzyme family
VTLSTYAFPLLPVAGDRTSAVVDAGGDWSVDPPSRGVDVLLWGSMPLIERSLMGAVRVSMARERAIRKARKNPPDGLAVRGLHYLAPPSTVARAVRERVRGFLLKGVLVDLSRHPGIPRVVDAVAEAAQVSLPVRSFATGADGLAVVRVRSGGERCILRFAIAGSPGDPARSGRALEHLAAAGVAQVPVLLRAGRTAGAFWTLETALPGQPLGRTTRGLLRQVARFCTELPVSGGTPTAPGSDLCAIASSLPDRAAYLSELMASIERILPSVPGVTRHGDLWPRNVLVSRQRLQGVIDWDAWHPSAIPGTDLLQLFLGGRVQRTRRPLGRLWAEGLAGSPEFLDATGPYWRSMDIAPTAALLDAMTAACWAGWVTNRLFRHPHLLMDRRWLHENVDTVLPALRATVARGQA